MSIVRRVAAVACCALLTVPAASSVPQRAAPDCALHVSGHDGSLKQLVGKVVYVDFWASWCVACLASFPFMEQIQRDLGPKGLQVVAVNLDQKAADAERFLARHRGTFPIALGGNEACAKQFGVGAMPSTFFVDRAGKIRAVHPGFRPGEAATIRTLVERLLAEPARS